MRNFTYNVKSADLQGISCTGFQEPTDVSGDILAGHIRTSFFRSTDIVFGIGVPFQISFWVYFLPYVPDALGAFLSSV